VQACKLFVPIDTENITPDDQKYFEDVANEFNHPYAIVSTDGDSDRPFVIDGNGVFYRGDILGALVAKWLSADFCALPISSSDAIDDYLTQDNIPYVHTKIGSPYVIDAMNSAINDGKSKVVGWEVNGGFLIGANITIANKKLEKLPTRDALFPIIVALIAAKDSSIASVFKDLQARYTDAGLIDDFPQEISQKIISTLSVADGTAINLIEKTFIGFGKVKEINSLDGVRIYFDNGEIAHIRPSGNAPQLRIYSIANSPERAKEIVSLAIQEQNGIFRNLQKQLS
jgi:phosphomannomutase